MSNATAGGDVVTVALSDLAHGGTTRLRDLALVCANCHRMLHRRRPWLGIRGLRKLLTEPAGA